MMYPYMTLSDETEVTHSEILKDGSVRVYFEKAIYGGFKNASCYLPDYRWTDIDGYSGEEIRKLTEYLHHNAHLIMEFAGEGGFANAAAV